MGFSMKIRGGQDRSAKHHSRFILWQNRAKSHRAHTAEICYKPLLKVDNEGTSRILMPRERGITVEYALTRRSALGAAGAGAVLLRLLHARMNAVTMPEKSNSKNTIILPVVLKPPHETPLPRTSPNLSNLRMQMKSPLPDFTRA